MDIYGWETINVVMRTDKIGTNEIVHITSTLFVLKIVFFSLAISLKHTFAHQGASPQIIQFSFKEQQGDIVELKTLFLLSISQKEIRTRCYGSSKMPWRNTKY